MSADIHAQLESLARFYKTGETAGYGFRKKQLLVLKAALKKYETELHDALYSDLKKSPEESWITETGLLSSALNQAINNLKGWMKAEKVSTNLLNFPSSSYIFKEPLGVILIIGAWNYPIQLLFMPLIGSMAAGNCSVLKASEFAPATSAIMKKIIKENFSSDYILYVEGEGEKMVPELMRTFTFNHIFYTGSLYAGKLIYKMAAEKLTPVTLELGGKSPCVVESDAEIKVAAKRIAVSKFSNTGQMCVAPDYILAHRSIKDQLTEELIKHIREWYSDDPASNYHYGKIINQKQFHRIVKYLEHGKIIYGGGYDPFRLFIEPTLIEDLSFDASIMEDEIFGPVLPIISFDDFAEAKIIIEKNPDPLAFYLFTQSREKEKQWLKIPFGGGCVNNVSWHFTNFNLPFGGRGNSGMGSYHGKFSFELFSHKKAIMKTPTWFDPSLKYPPFQGKLNLFKKILH